MIGGIGAELLVLRKRAATWILLAAWAGIGAFFSYVLPYATYRNAARGASPDAVSDLLPHGLVDTAAASFPFDGGVIALMLGALSMGSEFGWGTLKTLFTQRPGRLHILAAKLAALGIALVPFVLAPFVVGAASGLVIARLEGLAGGWPSAWSLIPVAGAGWLILAVWAAFGVMLAVLSRGTALAVGLGVLYALIIEGLVSAFANQVEPLWPLVDGFLRANAYSLVRGAGARIEGLTDGGPGAFMGPFVDGAQALLVLAAYLVVFVAISGYVLRRRDVT
jgi:ABC-type transport system involved in multi-copper enzyme maturation permease subunit